MTKFVFTSQLGEPGEDLSYGNRVEFDAEQLDDVVGNFELFLRGCGFMFNGHVDIVNTEWTQHNTFNNSPYSDSEGGDLG